MIQHSIQGQASARRGGCQFTMGEKRSEDGNLQNSFLASSTILQCNTEFKAFMKSNSTSSALRNRRGREFRHKEIGYSIPEITRELALLTNAL
jgi:hypothetical protein